MNENSTYHCEVCGEGYALEFLAEMCKTRVRSTLNYKVGDNFTVKSAWSTSSVEDKIIAIVPFRHGWLLTTENFHSIVENLDKVNQFYISDSPDFYYEQIHNLHPRRKNTPS